MSSSDPSEQAGPPDPSLLAARRPSAWFSVRRLAGIAGRYRGGSTRVLVLHLTVVCLGLFNLGLCGLAIDFLRHEVAPAGPPPGVLGSSALADWPPLAVVALIGAAVLLLATMNAAARYAAAVASAELSQKILVQLRTEVYDKLQRLAFPFFDANESSSLINRAAGDVQAVRSFVDGVVIRLFTVVLTLGVYVTYMLNVHVGLTLACLATTPLLWFGAASFSRAVQPAYRRAGELTDDAISLLVESVHGVHVVKGFGREREQTGRFSAAVERIRAERQGIFRRIGAFQPLMGALTQVNLSQ